MRRVNAVREKMESNLKTPQSESLEKELRVYDDRLRVIFVDPEVGRLPPKARAPGMIPGRWHVKVLVHGRRNVYFSLTGPNWEYRDPESNVVEEMKSRSLLRPGALEEIRRGEEEENIRRHRAEVTEAEAREEQTAAAYRAAKRVFGDGGATKNFTRKRRGEGLRKRAKELILPAGSDR